MLSDQVIDRIKESVSVELSPRDDGVRRSIHAALNSLAARGLARSGNEIHERAMIGCNELDVRAALIWGIIQRSYGAFGDGVTPTLALDLQRYATELISRAASVIRGLVEPTGHGWPRDVGSYVQDSIHTKRDQLVAKYQNEVHFYVNTISKTSTTAPGGVTVHGNVTSIQTGAHAVAHIHVDTAVTPRLIDALSQLAAAIDQAQEMSAEQRAQSTEIANSAVAAAKAPKPNGNLILGLLTGLSTTVQAVASVQPAWQQVKTMAAAIGIPLPF